MAIIQSRRSDVESLNPYYSYMAKAIRGVDIPQSKASKTSEDNV
jgi:hypothetical protein